MSNPWDVPPLPSTADEDDNATYAGVGRVLTQWEGIESNLSRIFSMFHNKPDDYETIRKYGEPLVFTYRFSNLQRVATQFFIKRHNQEIEGTLDEMADKIVGFSLRRNEVAHGIVNMVQFYPWFLERAGSLKPHTRYWALIPPYHSIRSHKDTGGNVPLSRIPAFVYTSIELRELEQKLQALYGEIGTYREKLRMFLAKPA
jgi:hypothetical protein